MRNWLHQLTARNDKKNLKKHFQPALEALENRLVPTTFFVLSGATGNGSQSTPFGTIQQAADVVQAGDTVMIEKGTYAGFDVQTSGTASAPITFEAAPGATVTINAPEGNRKDSGINIEDWNNGAAMNYITIEGLHITSVSGNLKMGIRAVWNGSINGTGIQLIDNTITGCTNFGILTSHEDNLLIEGNSVSGTTGTGTLGHGIYVSNASFNPHVIDNVLFNNQSLGLHMNGDASEGAAVEADGTSDGNNGNIIGAVVEGNIIYDNGLNGINADGLQNSLVENNLLYDNGGGIVLYQIDAAAPATNNVIANNTVTVLTTDKFGNTGRWDIQIMDGSSAGSTGNTVFNNILINQNSNHGAIEVGALSLTGFHSNNNVITTSGDGGSASSHAFDLVDASGNDNFVSLATWQSNTGQDKNSLTATSAQLFVSPSWTAANGNYQLLSTSPAIDKGLATFQGAAAPATDILGNSRPSGSAYDIGAYEFQSAVVQSSTTTSLSSSATTAPAGQSVTLTATVTSGTAGSITGTVTFMDGSTTLGTGTVGSNGQATVSTSSLAVGSHSITAVYSGNTSYAGSTSSALSETINQATSTTSVSTSAVSITAGQSVTFTATVVSSTGIAVGGTVTFKDGSTTLGTGTVGSNGQATFSTSSLAVGSHTITAVFGGNTNVSGSTSSSLTETVSAGIASTSTVLTSSATTAQAGQSVTITATVSSGTAGSITGTVTFKDGSTTLGTGSVGSNGQATFSTSSLAVGSHSITAVYGGNGSYSGSTSTALAETINQATSTTSLSTSAASITAGQSVTFTATVVSSTGIAVGGTVTFKDGSTTLGTGTVGSNGQVTFSTSSLAAGSHTITAVYGGNTNVSGSASSGLTQTVTQPVTATSATSLTTSAATVAFGQSVTFTATVTTSTGVTATGSVTFKNGSTVIGSASLVNGKATFSTSSLTVGSHTITAVYGGAANITGSTSASLTEKVTRRTTTTTLQASALSIHPGQSITFTATVASTTSGTPTGTVTFKKGSTVLGTGTLVNGVATFTTSALPSGNDRITAVYGGDTDDRSSTSTSLLVTVK
jgi:hypothetical protein